MGSGGIGWVILWKVPFFTFPRSTPVQACALFASFVNSIIFYKFFILKYRFRFSFEIYIYIYIYIGFVFEIDIGFYFSP